MWELGGESICFREKRKTWVWEIDHRIKLRAQERRREYEGPVEELLTNGMSSYWGSTLAVACKFI